MELDHVITSRLNDLSISKLTAIKAYCKEMYAQRVSGDNIWLERYNKVNEILNEKILLIFET